MGMAGARPAPVFLSESLTMNPHDEANGDDARDATWQPNLFGTGAESRLTQRPLFDGGMDRGKRPAPARRESAALRWGRKREDENRTS